MVPWLKASPWVQRSAAVGGLTLIALLVAFAVLRFRRDPSLVLATGATPTAAPEALTAARPAPSGPPAIDAAAPQATRTATLALG
ncbi:MAG: hypothetical protein V1772_03070 [Chloroflexota bacterium]